MDPPSKCHLTDATICQSDTNVPVDCPSSKWYQPPLPDQYTYDDVDCTDSFWSDTCAVEFCNRQSDAQVQAGTIMSIPYIISACLSPFLGGFVDRYGMRAVIATISPLALVVVHSFLAFSKTSPIGPLVGQGLAYSGFAAVVWPSIALVIDPKLVGLGYGIVVSIQNSGLAAFPVIIAQIYANADNQYIPKVEEFFIGLAILGCVIGVYLNFYDFFFMNHLLNQPRKDEAGSRANSKAGDDEKFIGVTNPVVNSEDERTSRNSHSSRSGRKHFDDDDSQRRRSRATSSELLGNSTSLLH